MINESRATPIRSSKREKPFQFLWVLRRVFMQSSSKPDDHLQSNGHSEANRLIRIGITYPRTHDHELGVGTQRLDIPADVIICLPVACRRRACGKSHGVVAYSRAREIDVSAACQRRSGAGAASSRANGMPRPTTIVN